MALTAGNLLQLSPPSRPMTEEKPDYEPSEEEIEALKQVVEESREGLSKLAEEENAAERRDVLKNLLRKIKARLGQSKAETTEINA